MSSQPGGQTCAYCGLAATHFCSGCGKWVCDKGICASKAAVSAITTNPLQAIRSAPAAGRHAAATVARVVADALNFKP